ncbi:hypothetical protein MKW94_003796, partial [Papaver nudicaule]|nr:hypothetical protein [Papaver nudicaule]
MSYCLLIIFVINYLVGIFAQPTFLREFCSGGNYTTNSTYQSNLNLLLSSALPVFKTEGGVSNEHRSANIGDEPDTVYGSYQCRSDLKSNECQDCFDSAAEDITKIIRCPNSKQGILWFEECILRYSNESLHPILQDKPVFYIINETTISSTNQDDFNKTLARLVNKLVTESTVAKNQFATGEETFAASRKVYGLVQCTLPDISSSDCNKCLSRVAGNLSVCCHGKIGARVLNPTCNFRYELYPFYESKAMTATPPQSSLPPTYETTRRSPAKIVTMVVVPLVVTILCIITIWFLRTRRATRKTKKIDKIYEIHGVESVQFNFNTIRAATNNFSNVNKLGEGGFGPVYKGILSDEQEIAVKRLSRYSDQGEEEFKNEVALLVKLQHRNLVRLLGFCLDGHERLLVYNFMPNSSLDKLIF